MTRRDHALTALVEVGVDPLLGCAKGVVQPTQESRFVESIECCRQVKRRPRVIVYSTIDVVQHSQECDGFVWVTAPVRRLILVKLRQLSTRGRICIP